ncbi:hypothetical protein ACHAPZ_002614 [Fusarium culmorum]
MIQEDFANRLERVETQGQFAKVLQKFVMLLNKLAVAGDMRISWDPATAASPWVAIRAIHISCAQSLAMQDKLLEGSTKITNLVALCGICRKLYLPVDDTNPDKPINAKHVDIANLEKAIV